MFQKLNFPKSGISIGIWGCLCQNKHARVDLAQILRLGLSASLASQPLRRCDLRRPAPPPSAYVLRPP